MQHQEKSPSPAPGIATSAMAPASPGPSKSKGLKTEKDTALPPFSLGGSSEPALSGSQAHPTGSGGGTAQAQDLRLSKHRPLAGRHYQCSSHGCKLAFHSMQELMDHLRVHYRPTQSLEGKTFHCPTSSCAETFPSMQDLMAHMKVHYKPNRYFKCENCLLRFQTHRSLFKHLHVCSDSASSPAPAPAQRAKKPILPAASSLDKDPPVQPREGLPKPLSASQHTKKEAILPSLDTASPAAPSSLPTSIPGLHGSLESASHPFPLLEPSLFGPSALTRLSGQPHSSGPGPFLSYMPPSPYSLPQASVQQRLRPYLPGQGLPVSNAVWKKSQGVRGGPRPPCFGSGVTPGHSSNSRIVWEHTRGRYTCMQCPFSSASREEITLHIEDQHKNPPLPSRLGGEMDFGVGLASYHAKLPPELLTTPLFPFWQQLLYIVAVFREQSQKGHELVSGNS
ncbi:zinc finger protein 414 isoform X2 [Carettochelys insculpta]|uniref:zinc finger protein 414 isoform X2 n=1 Tax=Carettochelys insculpta TaxID=44489 RepID=UPI003EC040DD